MNSRERVVAAMKSQDVDHVSFMPYFWGNGHPKAPWTNDDERMAYYAKREWDSLVWSSAFITVSPEVKFEFDYETHGETSWLCIRSGARQPGRSKNGCASPTTGRKQRTVRAYCGLKATTGVRGIWRCRSRNPPTWTRCRICSRSKGRRTSM